MGMVRSIVAVIVGYMIFALGTFAFFRLSGQPPHAPAPVSVMLESSVCGMAFALLGGYVAGWLAGRRPFAHACAMAIVLLIGAAVSLFATLGKGAVWSQLAALILMAPCALLGGWLRARQVVARQAFAAAIGPAHAARAARPRVFRRGCRRR